jgi:hypothetical protein
MKPVLRCLVLVPLLLPANAPLPVPGLIKGRFVDDYDIPHVITDSSWTLGRRDRYHVVASDDSAQYLIAWNDSANTSDPGKWARIDWIRLSGMPP